MVSLVTNPRHTVKVTPRRLVTTDEGDQEYENLPSVMVPCNVHPVSAYEVEYFGVHSNDAYALTCPEGTWVFDEYSLVEWDGEVFTQRGRVKKNRIGVRTRHDRIVVERGSYA